jgi:hypothetical protein
LGFSVAYRFLFVTFGISLFVFLLAPPDPTLSLLFEASLVRVFDRVAFLVIAPYPDEEV